MRLRCVRPPAGHHVAGDPRTEDTECCCLWKEHYDALYREGDSHSKDKAHWEGLMGSKTWDEYWNDPINVDELRMALRHLKNNKAQGMTESLPRSTRRS